MKKVTLFLALCLMTLSGFAAGYFPTAITPPDDGSGTSPTVCSGDPNGVYTVSVSMCPFTAAAPVPMTIKWYFNGSVVFTDPTPYLWTAATPFIATIPAGSFNWPAPGSYAGALGLRAEVSWMPPIPAPGCSPSPITGTSLTVFVSSAAPPITGSNYICVGATHTLHSTATGGVWFPTTGGNATAATSGIDERIGLITGVSVGTAIITYTGGSCMTPAYDTVTVVTTPPPIQAPANSVCSGETLQLSDTMWYGTWMSGGLATIDPVSGLMTGAPTPSGGTATITYQLTTTCRTTRTFTVNPMPTAITGTMAFCSGTTTTLASTPTGGTWSSANTAIATVGASNGVVFGKDTGATDTIVYNRLGCKVYAVVTVNRSPSAIFGPTAVCMGGNIVLSNVVSGGVWTSSAPAVATATPIGPAGAQIDGLTTGITTIRYTIGACPQASVNVTVTAPPTVIGGNVPVCVAKTITLTNGVAGGFWTTTDPDISVISSTGVVTGITAGTAVVTYSIGTNCDAYTTVTVNPLPAPWIGSRTVCHTYTTTLSDVDVPGTWTSSNSTNISIGLTSGVAIGNVVNGTATITYTLPTSCAITDTMRVVPLPSAIVGPPLMAVCEASMISLSNPTAGGGTWSSSNTTNAAVGSTTGIVTGAFGGVSGTTATISFTATTTGCFTSRTVSVNPLPVQYNVVGGGSYCAGSPVPQTIGMSNAASSISYRLYLGGTPVGTPVTGVTGAFNFGTFTAAGTYSVLATNPVTGCTNGMLGTAIITINPVVTPAISMATSTGSFTLCAGLPATFTATPSNGGPSPTYQWTVNGAPVGTSSPTHVYTPTTGDVISVTLTTSAPCPTTPTAVETHTLTVLPSGMPSVTTSVIPGTTVCAGTSVTFSAIPVNGGPAPTFLWTKNGTNVATGPTFTFIPANGDVIYCQMHSSATCNLVTDVFSPLTTMTVVTPGSAPAVFITATPGTTITPGTSVTLVATAAGAGTTPTFQWYLNGVAIAGATSSTYVSSTFNNHDSVTCAVTSSNTCKEKGAKSEIITVKSGNGGVGVGSLEVGNGVNIAPNPNNGVFTIKGQWSNENNEKVSLEVTDMVGKVIYTGNTTTKAGNVNAQITLPSVPAGMYMINMRSDSGNRVFRIVKD